MAERINFTKAMLESVVAKHDGSRRTIYDAKQAGLVVDLRGGMATFYLYKRIEGRPSRYRIGRFPDVTVDQARTEVIKHLGRIASGENPVAERRKARVEHTLGALFDHWLESHAKQHRRTWPVDQQRFDRYLSHLRTRRLSSIGIAELQSLHAKLGRDAGTTMANRVLQLITTLFNNAPAIGFRGGNPAENVKRFPEQSRDRFLQPDELPKFWNALAQESQMVQDFFVVALLTGARRGNVMEMRFEDLHLQSATWRIPHTKNDDPVLIHLPTKAVEILTRRKAAANDCPWVFPSNAPRGRTGHINKPTSIWKRIITRAGLENLRIHDLRRTLGSWQAIAGTSLPIIGRSLGHKSQAATKIYARLTLAPVRASVDAATTALLEAAQPKKRKGARNGNPR